MKNLLYKYYDRYIKFRNYFKNYPYIGNNDKHMFFIVGSGRSGSTLLRSILVSNNLVAIPPESYAFHMAYRKYRAFAWLKWPELVKLIVSEFESHPQYCTWNLNLAPVYQKLINVHEKERNLSNIIFQIYKLYAEYYAPEAILYGDKTPLNILVIKNLYRVFPCARYINIVRDGRDVVSSYLRTGLYSNIKDACNRWNISIQNAEWLKKKVGPKKLLEIKYENLVNETESVVQTTCNFLRIPFIEDMITNRRQTVKKMGDVNQLQHHSSVKRPIIGDSIGRWKINLNDEQINYVQTVLKSNLLKKGYKL